MSTDTVSFSKQISPLFRDEDVQCMQKFGVLLDDYGYMSDPANSHANAEDVYDRLTGKTTPRMPPGGPFWTQSQLELYAKWMSDGYQR
jgi:hypothetical protein